MYQTKVSVFTENYRFLKNHQSSSVYFYQYLILLVHASRNCKSKNLHILLSNLGRCYGAQLLANSKPFSFLSLAQRALKSRPRIMQMQCLSIYQQQAKYQCFCNFSATAAIASTVQIECASESIIVHISTEGNTDFHGLVYPRGLSKNSSCLQEYRSQRTPITYNLPLRSCNTMPTELVSRQN